MKKTLVAASSRPLARPLSFPCWPPAAALPVFAASILEFPLLKHRAFQRGQLPALPAGTQAIVNRRGVLKVVFSIMLARASSSFEDTLMV